MSLAPSPPPGPRSFHTQPGLESGPNLYGGVWSWRGQKENRKGRFFQHLSWNSLKMGSEPFHLSEEALSDASTSCLLSYFLTVSLPLRSSRISQTPEQLVPLNKSYRHYPGSGTCNSLEEFQVKGPSN